jgi:uncharacterized membrane protein
MIAETSAVTKMSPCLAKALSTKLCIMSMLSHFVKNLVQLAYYLVIRRKGCKLLCELLLFLSLLLGCDPARSDERYNILSITLIKQYIHIG